LLHTVLSVATLNVPGIETPAPPPIVMPFKRATCMDIIYCTNMSIWTTVVKINGKVQVPLQQKELEQINITGNQKKGRKQI
jgi:hypothetical protein